MQTVVELGFGAGFVIGWVIGWFSCILVSFLDKYNVTLTRKDKKC